MISVISSLFEKPLGKFFILSCLLLILAPLFCSQFYHTKIIAATLQIITQNNISFLSLRCIFIGTLIIFWPKLIVYVAHKKQWSAKKTIHWQKQRWVIAVWLITIELLVCENIPLLLMKSI